MSDMDGDDTDGAVGHSPSYTGFNLDAEYLTPTSVESEQNGVRSVYGAEGDDATADDVDPKRLFRTPSIDDIRWFYRNGALASTIVDRPVDDAFKHGYSVGDTADDTQQFLQDIEDAYRKAHRNARRDGFALLWFRLRDTASEWEPPENVDGIHEAKVLTIDDLTNRKPIAFEEKLTAGNAQNIMDPDAGQSVSSTEAVTALGDLIQRAEEANPNLNTDSVAETRLSRDDADPAQLAADAVIEDPSIERGELDGRLMYGRSRLYDITENGIVISNRLDDERFEQPISYLYDRGAEFQPLMIHPQRVFHITWRGDVDGDVGDRTWGGYEGDSVLMPIIHLLRSMMKGNWATMQSLFRHSAPLHVVSYDEGTDKGKVDEAEQQMHNINTKSSIMEPPGFEVRSIEKIQQNEVEPSYSVLFDQICAATEMTRSVLFGTQAGTVSGSEVDIKNYFNKIERLRRNRYESELRDLVNWYSEYDATDYELDNGLQLEWGPLFKLSELDRAEAMARHVQLVSQAQTNFVMSDEEARSFLEEQWTDWTDVDLSGILEDDEFERLYNILGASDGSLSDIGGNPRVGQNGGGMEQGQSTASENPSSE